MGLLKASPKMGMTLVSVPTASQYKEARGIDLSSSRARQCLADLSVLGSYQNNK